ncbi:MAG: response regulator [Deltaproteobacteria bacterium]|nr:response regulator [Deltaproteobacteria bacterium]MBN2674440.1 response regulator [Deltaproteobacteria bacterium]
MITATHSHAKPKVLIVNDNATELGSLLAGLEAEGFQVSGTTDAHAAVELLSQTMFHVVLIDLMIPDLNGLQLARKIRQQFPHTTTMLMSDYLLSPVQLAKADTGAIGFVPKPFHFKEIAGFVKEKLKNATTKSELSPALTASQVPIDILSVRYTC